MSGTAIPWLYFKDSKHVRHQNQISLLMMIMRCSRSRVKLGLILKIHRHYKHPSNKFSISVRGSCPISSTALEVITKLFALLCYFKESGCDDGLGICHPIIDALFLGIICGCALQS